jgi:hypothetical protein
MICIGQELTGTCLLLAAGVGGERSTVGFSSRRIDEPPGAGSGQARLLRPCNGESPPPSVVSSEEHLSEDGARELARQMAKRQYELVGLHFSCVRSQRQ